MNKIENSAKETVEPFLKENGCILWDVIFEKEGAMHYLRILFDAVDTDNTDGADGGKTIPLDLDKCEKLTPPLNKLIDAQDFVKQVDILEIGAPGITRRLRSEEHFIKCKGKTVRVMTRNESNGKTDSVIGVLTEYNKEDKSIVLNSEDNETVLPLKKCIRVTLEA